MGHLEGGLLSVLRWQSRGLYTYVKTYQLYSINLCGSLPVNYASGKMSKNHDVNKLSGPMAHPLWPGLLLDLTPVGPSCQSLCITGRKGILISARYPCSWLRPGFLFPPSARTALDLPGNLGSGTGVAPGSTQHFTAVLPTRKGWCPPPAPSQAQTSSPVNGQDSCVQSWYTTCTFVYLSQERPSNSPKCFFWLSLNNLIYLLYCPLVRPKAMSYIC